MYIVQHALLNLHKNKGRNILLFSIILAVITSVTVAIIIWGTANQVISEYSGIFSRRVTISPARRQVATGGARQSQSLPIEQALGFAESGYLRSAEMEIAGRVYDISDPATHGEILYAFTALQSLSDNPVPANAVFYLRYPEMLPSFAAEVRGMGLSDDFNIGTNMAEYHRLIAPVERLGSVAIAFLMVVLLLGAIIIALLCIISVNERKYEIGILRAMGMKKSHVAAGLMTEIITITAVAFALAVWVGAMLAGPVSAMILDADTALTVQTNLGLRSATEVLCLSILLAVVAGGFAVSRITKYEPNIILAERG